MLDDGSLLNDGSLLDEKERARLLSVWHETVLEFLDGAAWAPLLTLSPVTVLTAWNPHGRTLPESVNLGRDRVLRAELQARGLEPVRTRGSAPDHASHEDGWMIDDDPDLAVSLLRRYGQLAAFRCDGGDREVLWADGRVDAL